MLNFQWAMNKRTHIVIPAMLAAEIDRLVGRRRRSSFLTQAALREVKRLRMLRALRRARGAWKSENHPELKGGAAAWVDKLRRGEEKRFKGLTG